MELGPFSLTTESVTLQLGPFNLSTVFNQVPVINLIGQQTMSVVQFATFYDPGVTVTDEEDLANNVVVTGSVDTATPGTYIIRYNVSDSAGNAAQEVVRVVTVEELIISIDDLTLSNLKKYFRFTASETANDIGWGHRSFENNADLNIFGQINNPSEAYLYGQKILGLGVSKASIDQNSDTLPIIILADESYRDSMNNHVDPNKPFVEKVTIFSNNTPMSQIKTGSAVPVVEMDFTQALESEGNIVRRTDQKRDIAYFGERVSFSQWSNMQDGENYIAEVEINQQILKAEYSSVPENRFHPKPLRDAVFIPELIRVKPVTGIVFYQRGNDIELMVTYRNKPIDLSIFDQFIFTAGEVVIDSVEEPEIIKMSEEKGVLQLQLKDKFTTPGKYQTQLIAFSTKYSNGVVIWDKGLRNANFTINVFSL